MAIKMNSLSNIHQKSCRFQRIVIAIFTLSAIGFTTQSPAQMATNTQAPVARPKPVLGWNSIGPLGCTGITAEKLRWQADLMAEKGLIKAGYTTFVIECGWEEDYGNYPLVLYDGVMGQDYHSFRDDFRRRGLGLGFGTWGGPQLCPRTEEEAKIYAKPKTDLDGYVFALNELGATYLSHRPCDWGFPQVLQSDMAVELNSRYVQMESAISNRGYQNKMFYATGQWGASPSAVNTKANSWRIADDTLDSWNSFIRTLNTLYPYSIANRGPYNDLGFLQLGENRLTMAEKRTQFCFWAAAKSPLIFSTDVSRLHPDEIGLLTNPRAIAVNQDALGQSITLKHRYPDMDIWSGPLSDGSTVAVIINWSDDSSQKNINLEDLGFSSAHVYEVLSGKDLGVVSTTYVSTIEKHGSLFLKFTKTKPARQRTFQRFPVEVAEITGSAILKLTSQGVKVAGNLKADGETGVRWKNIPGSRNGNTVVSFDYVNADLAIGNMDDTKLNFKRTAIIINESTKYDVDFPITGLTWDNMIQGFLVSLPLKPGYNTIRIQAEGDWAPDFHCLSVEQRAQQYF
ncbi:hypothetical protein PTTG_01087 [Puccinia triticina 1-1 BBBD Race 1]|uniref:Alpha-galactosidase n=1 Tax=Puccinia triticina (isolate 1-1 / race 1 (BBBD)) TaxID=630390 RepID=A0A180GZT2_PUCT1|nr:hypothetical protein PTTG_01087 [Puccinia triticina 1-1 BBBD Race 1]